MTRLCNCPESLASKLELESRKSQLTEESCKTCGGRFLVDGIGPVSASMLSTVSLEVTNSMNPELSWKRVTKGRRSRKPAARNVNGFAKLGSRSSKRVGDFSVSDSDKFDESATGRHFPDKAEHIPIKKRRHLLQSPSPLPHSSFVDHEESLSAQPQTPSPHTDHWRSDSCTKPQFKGLGGSAAVKSQDNVDRVDDDTLSDVTDRKPLNPDDFSGIALLAAAACIDSMDDFTNNVKNELLTEELLATEKSNASTSLNSIRRCNTFLELENPVQKEVVKEEIVQCSSADNSGSLSRSLHENDDGGTVRSDSSKVDRLHWDLNIVMDAWEQPFDDSVEGAYSKDVSDQSIKGENLEREVCETPKKAEDNQCGANNHMPPDETEENKSEPVCAPDKDCSKEMGISKFDEHSAKSIDNLHADAGNCNQLVRKISSNLSSLLPKSHEASCVSIDEEIMHAASGSIGVLQEDTKKLKEILSSDNVMVALENNALPELFSESSALKSVNSRIAEDSGKIYDLPENSTCLTKIVSTDICKTQDPEISGSNLYDVVHHSQSSRKCEDLSVSGVSTHLIVCSPKGQHDRVSTSDAMVTECQEHEVPKEPASKHDNHYVSNEGAKTSFNLLYSSKRDDGSPSGEPTSGSAKIGSSLEDCHNSDVSQDDHSNRVVLKDMTELQAGYDSPYEDGEVRVSMSCPWEENEIDDGENECVDYESDAREGVDSDGADYPGSEVVEAGSEGPQRIDNRSLVVREGSVSDFNKSGTLKSSLRMHYMKDDIEKIDNGGSGATSGQFERNSDSVRRRHTSDHMDVVDLKGSRLEEESGSRATRGKLLSRIEGPSSLDLSERKDTGFLPQSRSRFHSRPGRDFSPDKFISRQRSSFHVRGGNGGDEQWGYWDSRNRFPSSYHGHDGNGYSRTRSIITDSADKFGGLNSQDHRQSINYSSKGIHRTLASRSPFDRDDYYSVHRRMMPAARDITTNRSRGGSGNYLQGVGRGGIRGDQNEAFADHRATSSGRMPRYLSRRDRSFSPSSGKVPQNSLPRRKSRSRSRTRSPHVWHSRRERNQGIRRQSSRSPDFRSEARVERVRIPLQKPSFPADYSGSVMSPPRGRSSPQRNCRWVDDHDYMDDYSRDRRSPVRLFRWGQRFDSGRLKSDDYFRPMIRPGRFPPISGTGRGCKFEDNYDDRRRDDRVEIIHRARHSDSGGNVNRFRHDAENNFEDDVRNTDRRDVSRSSREDKRSFKV